MIDYRNSKTSIHIEEQLPFPAKANGDTFMNFLKTYYDWLERRIVIIEGKADFPVTDDDIVNGSLVSGNDILLGTEDTPSLVIVDERADYTEFLENNYSLKFDGESTHVDVDHSIINLTNDWSIGLFIKILDYPSILRNDYDVITLSHTHYLSILKIPKDSNQICYNIGGGDVNTGIDIRTNEWYYITIRYSNGKIYYDIFNTSYHYTYEASITFTTTSDRFVIGCDLYEGRNFSYANIDEVSVWDKFLTDEEIVTIYNEGTPIDLTTTTNLTDYFRFEEIDTIIINSINTNNNGTLYGDYAFIVDVPINIYGFILEDAASSSLDMKILSYTIYDNIDTTSMLNRVLIFAEFYSGKIFENNILLKSNNGEILVGNYREVKNPLYAINNLANFQEIDYVCNYNNFISNDFFQYLWKEFTAGMPMNLAYVHESSIKDIIAKSIIDFYKTKGTLDSFKHFFKILYNEDLSIGYMSSTSTGSFDSIIDEYEDDQVFEYDKIIEDGENIYSNDTFEYTIKTRFYASEEVKTYLKKLCHPVGFKMNLLPKT